MTPEEHDELKDDLWKQYRLQGADAAVQASPDQNLREALSSALHPSIGTKLRYGGLGALGGAVLGGGAGALSHLIGKGTSAGIVPSIRDTGIIGSLGGAVTGLNILQHRRLQKALENWKSDKEKTAAARWKKEMPQDLRDALNRAMELRNQKATGLHIDENMLSSLVNKFQRTRGLIADKVYGSAPMSFKESLKVPSGFSKFDREVRRRAASRASSATAGAAANVPSSVWGSVKNFAVKNKWPLIGLGGAAGLGGLALLSSRLANREQDKNLRGEFA